VLGRGGGGQIQDTLRKVGHGGVPPSTAVVSLLAPSARGSRPWVAPDRHRT
jgi:hypothetical protein